MWTWHVWKVNRVLADISSSYFPKASQAKRLWRCFCKEHSSSDSSGVCGAYWTCAPLVLRVFWCRNSGSCWTTTQVTLTPGAYWPSGEYGLFQLKGTEAWSSCKAIFPLPCGWTPLLSRQLGLTVGGKAPGGEAGGWGALVEFPSLTLESSHHFNLRICSKVGGEFVLTKALYFMECQLTTGRQFETLLWNMRFW